MPSKLSAVRMTKAETVTQYREPGLRQHIAQHSKWPTARLVMPDSALRDAAPSWPGECYAKWLRYVNSTWFPQEWTVVI